MDGKALSIAAALGLALSGSSGDDSGGGAGMSGADGEMYQVGRSLEGIYELTEHRLNQQTCEAGGAYVEGHAFFALSVLGRPALAEVHVISCESEDACRTTRDAFMTGGSFLSNFYFVLLEADGEDSLVGEQTVAIRAGDVCFRQLTDAVLERAEDGSLSIEAKYWVGEDYAPDSGGSCNTGEGAPNMDEPCTELERLSAERVADF
jgi:hypothetical protein